MARPDIEVAPSKVRALPERTQAPPHAGSGSTRTERLLDGVVHVLGAIMSMVAIAILIKAIRPTLAPLTVIATAIYGIGLLAMIWLSAAYNLIRRPDWKERLRRYDHAAIFLMIAGTYTPFALIGLGGVAGHALLAIVWLAAIAGIALKLLRSGWYERSSVAAYLALGWIGLPAAGLLMAVLPRSTVMLLGVGGLLYTAGVVFHLRTTLHFQNAIWHVFVLVAAICHLAAVLQVVAT